jgi:hypothetical protein
MKGEVRISCWWGNQKERDHWGEQDCRWGYNIKIDLQNFGAVFI